MRATAKIWKIGHSLVISIPKAIRNELGLERGTVIEIDIKRIRET